MLFDIFVKWCVTPENILGLMWNLITIVGMMLIFHAWKEKWWKSLIPFYGTYLIYKNAWKERKWLFFVQMIFDLISVVSARVMKKHVTSNLLTALKTYLETDTIDIDISIPYLLICAGLLLVSMIVVFLLTRITYLKICDSLGIKSLLLKVGTFIVPQIFLIVDYVYVMRKGDFMRKKNILLGMITLLALSLWGCGANQAELSTTEETSTTTVEASNGATEEANTADVATSEEESATASESADIFDLSESQEYYENMYQSILNDTYATIIGGMDAYEYKDGNSGIGEVIMNDDGNAKDVIGYTFVDSNMDGEVELVIGSINEEKDGKHYGEMIYSAYTYREEPVLILEGWSRNRCHLLNDGTYYVEGSGGAMYSIFENKQLEKNGTKFIYNDYCFTCEKDETFEEIGFYRNSTGEWDKGISEEISEEEYTNSFDEYSSKILTLGLKPFSMYEYSGTSAETDSQEITVRIEWATDAQLSDNTLPSFEVDTSEPQVAVIVSPSADAHNFKVLSLSYEDVDSADNPVFIATELHQQEVLSSGTEFVIKFAMFGTIPSYGISYEDASGKTYYYGLTESGMDGSPLLTEIVVK